MKADLKSKFIDGLLSIVIIMAIMYPLIIMFRYLAQWGLTSYWVAAVLFLVASTWMLYRTTLEKLSKVGRAWYGIVGGLFAWTIIEISSELSLIDVEGADFVLVLALAIAFLAVLWKYFPMGTGFWIVIFMMNWVGHVYIHVAEKFLVGSAAKALFMVTAAAYGLLIIGLIVWIFAWTTTRIQRLWAGVWIWWSLSMIFFLMR